MSARLALQLARNYAALALDRVARPQADRAQWEAEVADLERIVGHDSDVIAKPARNDELAKPRHECHSGRPAKREGRDSDVVVQATRQRWAPAGRWHG